MSNLITDLVKESLSANHHRSTMESIRTEDRLKQVESGIDLIIGGYGSGKTTRMNRLINGLIDSGVDRRLILFVDFADARIGSKADKDLLGKIIECYMELVPLARRQTFYCFFDNFDSVDNWEPFITPLMQTYSLHLIASGASRRWIGSKFETLGMLPLTKKELNPLTDNERILRRWLCSTDSKKSMYESELSLLRPSFQSKAIEAIVFDTLRKHVLPYEICIQTARKAMGNSGRKLPISALVKRLRNDGISTTRNTIGKVIDCLEESIILHTLRDYKFRDAQNNRASSAYIPDDPTFAWGFSSDESSRGSSIARALVFKELQRMGFKDNVFTYRTKKGKDASFVYSDNLNAKIEGIILVSNHAIKGNSVVNVLKAAFEAMDELDVERALFLNPTKNDDVYENGKRVTMMSYDLWFNDSVPLER